MLARLLLSLVLALVTWSGPAMAQEPELVIKKAVLLPFPVLSKTPLDFLGQKVLQEFQERFQAEGLTLVPQEEVNREVAALKEPLNETLAKEMGRKLRADVVVWGQLIIVGDALALEARILDITGKLPPTPMKVEGTGLKSLAGLNNRLAQEVALKIIGKERIANIEVKGNRRIEKDAILGAMQTREGEFLSPVRLREDLKSIYKMGYFTDVKLEVSDSPPGKILIVVVDEKPAIREIYIKGNRKIKEKAIREVMDLKPFTVASEAAIQENINKVLNLYREKSYYEAKVNYSLQDITKTEVNLVLEVNEGGKLSIKDIKFEGNKAFKAKELRKVMETKERDFLTWITGSGRLVKDTLERDLEKIAAYYFNHGYIRARVGDPRIDIKDNRIYITIPIEEGPEYRMGKVDFQGDLLEDKEKLRGRLEIVKEEVYSREVLQKDLTELADFYADHGYANADITPLIKEHDENRTVDVTFDIHQGNKVYFERIEIAGNIKTRDKVIRRELRVYEQELFSATKLKESTKNLRRLEYFEDVNFSTSPGSTPDRMNLKITVKERPTGSFGVGAGYSTQDRIVGMLEISQNNLFGRGQQLKLQGIIGAISNRFRFSFMEPYLFDRPLALGLEAFSWERQYDEYNRQNVGGALRLAHPLRWQYTRLYGVYRFENVKMTDLGPNPAQALAEAARIHNTSAAGFTLRRDSRDAQFTPTRGSDNAFNLEIAGLGGDTAFLRYILESGYYHPLWWSTVGVIHGRMGYMQRLPWGELPAYEKFYLGGIDTIRGFKYAEISPRDPRTLERIGGEKFVQLNLEYRFPIPMLQRFGFLGVVFFDAGNVYANNVNYFSSLRTSVGTGFRWFSPMGPLRVEWGYNLKPKSFEKNNAWEFTVGSSF
ncbi:MAG: outer membrane protein assembly factor BamA [Deltaproteobacteria bacterium RBG_13_58_19]|nr:MAG: outer membrane protein assembly factor BamA [Deltaproteobacteria bacterium RBG_13_58_19]